MKADALLEHLEAAAEQLGVKVSYEQISQAVGHTALARGGLCRVKGQFRVIIDKRASAAERVQTLATALGRFDTTALTLPDAVRATLDTHDPRASSPDAAAPPRRRAS